MNHISRTYALAGALTGIAAVTAAQTATEVCDINKVETAVSSQPESNGAGRGMLRCGNAWYFSAYTWKYGRELWRTDGTLSGTRLVADLFPGAEDSDPISFCCGKDSNGNDLLFFFARTPTGLKAFFTDGTTAGTSSGTLANIPSGTTPFFFKGRIYYPAQGSGTGTELFSADGKEPTHSLVADIYPGSASSYPGQFIASVDGQSFYFSAADGYSSPARGQELWISDGSSAGTKLLADIVPGTGSSSPQHFTNFKGKTLFVAYTPTSGTELWTTDGTSAGTTLFADLNPGSASSGPNLALQELYGGELFFTAADAATGTELWKTDGTPAGTVLAADLAPGTNGSFPRELCAIGTTLFVSANRGELFAYTSSGATSLRPTDAYDNKSMQECRGKLLFLGFDATIGQSLYVSDGTVAGTTLLRSGLQYYSIPTLLSDGRCLFVASEGDTPPLPGTEFWISDATIAGTQLWTDLEPGVSTADGINSIMASSWGTHLAFFANDGVTGSEPYVWSRTGGCIQLADLRLGGSSQAAALELVTCGDLLYFRASTSTQGIELIQTDGTPAGTIVHDLYPGSGSSSPGQMTVWNNKLYFVADNGSTGSEVFVADPVTKSVSLLKDIYPGRNTGVGPGSFTRCQDKLFFVHSTPGEGAELWVTDGTEAGTVLVKDINVGTASSSPADLTCCGGKLLFSALDATNGRELWESDGTSSGTRLVADIRAGTLSSSPTKLTCCNVTTNQTRLFFSANDGANGTELWSYDGTTTALVKDINSGSLSSSPTQLTCIDGTLYFVATDSVAGYEAWTSDGTSQGTVRLADITPGTGTGVSTSVVFVACGDRVFFAAGDTTSNTGTGSELYVTDGTPANTKLVKDIYPGSVGSFPSRMVCAGDRVYFTAQEPTTGRELWVSDGSESGTNLVTDINPDSLSSNPDQLAFVDGSLLFFARSLEHGAELWRVECAGSVVQELGPGCDAIELTCTPLELGKKATMRGHNVPDSATHIGLSLLSLPRVRPTFDGVRFDAGCWNWIDAGSFIHITTHTTSPDWVNPNLEVPNDPTLRCLTVVMQTWYLNRSSGVPVKTSTGIMLSIGQ
ncbi:MAG: hypothetical protein H6832_16165 [Planctomycetes bacterium]|nr:hypothetical protein [Planctomycetota bacterium]